MTVISLYEEVGDFAEDKDAAAWLRTAMIEPELARSRSVVLDFSRVRLTTQSFIHALICSSLRDHGESVLELLEFRRCNKLVRGIVETVVQYSLETIDDNGQG